MPRRHPARCSGKMLCRVTVTQAGQRDLATLSGRCRRLQLPPLERHVLGRLHLRQQVVGPFQLADVKRRFGLALQLGDFGIVTGGGRDLGDELLVALGDLDELRFLPLGWDLGLAQRPEEGPQGPPADAEVALQFGNRLPLLVGELLLALSMPR